MVENDCAITSASVKINAKGNIQNTATVESYEAIKNKLVVICLYSRPVLYYSRGKL